MSDAIFQNVDLTVRRVQGKGKARIEGGRKGKKEGKDTGDIEGEKLQTPKLIS